MAASDILVVGDSVAWGQGLTHDSKFASLVAADLADSPLARDRILARSGAPIGLTRDPDAQPISAQTVPDRTARHEVPWSRPTIVEQLAAIPDDRAETADLLLVVGGINDVDIRTILSPGTDQLGGSDQPAADPDDDGDVDLESYVRQFCYEDVLDLLEVARETVPDATIVLGGYFPIVSDDTGSLAMDALLEQLAYNVVSTVLGRSVGNALYFHRRALYWLRRAVAEFDAQRPPGEPGVCFAPPGFGEANSLGASDPWLYGPGDDDPHRSIREDACETVYDSLSPGDLAGDAMCARAMTGHPNEAGAQAYADAILERYRSRRDRTVGDAVRPLAGDGGAVRYRETLERYGLDAEASARSALEHVVVDCIEVTVETGDNGTNSSIYLEIADGERWQLDRTLSDGVSNHNDFEADSVGRYTIDPRLDGRESPLRLAAIDRIAIEKDGLFDWKFESIAIELNGRLVHEESPSVLLSGDDRWESAYPAG